jgi:hypothetical protein
MTAALGAEKGERTAARLGYRRAKRANFEAPRPGNREAISAALSKETAKAITAGR